MPQLIKIGDKLFRINRAKNCLEVSSSRGVLWISRSCMTSRYGQLKDLLYFHGQIFAATDYGIISSRNEGADWGIRGSSKIAKSIVALQNDNDILLGMSDDGHMFFSNNEGADWGRRS